VLRFGIIYIMIIAFVIIIMDILAVYAAYRFACIWYEELG